MSKTPDFYIEDMRRAIGHIEEDISDLDVATFAADRRARQLVERNLEIISEASRRLPEQLKESTPEIPWKEIAGIGNILRHDYHDSRPDILWNTCKLDLPPLKEVLMRFLAHQE